MLLDFDSRFPIVSRSFEDRNPRETNIEKTRFDTINYFISNDKKLKKKYNNKKYTINKAFKKILIKELKNNNLDLYKDKNLINHLAYQHVRDGLVIRNNVEKGYVDSTIDYDLINSQNWNNVRLKTPIDYNKK